MKPLLALLTLLAATAAIASASTTAPDPTGTSNEVQQSHTPGRLDAVGAGALRFRARGRVRFELAGQGVLRIESYSENEVGLHGQGQVHIEPGGTLVVAGFQGVVVVQGQRLRGRFAGGPVRFHARGVGSAVLRGRGAFAANGSTGTWSLPGTPVHW